MSNHNVISKLNEDIFNKKNVACVTVINTEGSVPRDSGSKMLVYEDGSIYGTVGGGMAEKIAVEEAVKAIKEGKNKKIELDLTPKGIDALCMGKQEMFIEVYLWPLKVFIMGGGHVSKSLSYVLDFLSIPYTVVDDRKDIANRDNFKNAVDIINEFPHKAFSKLKIDKNSYIVIVTRGHSLDKECLEEAIKTDAKYIGMIGSRSKVKEIFKILNKKKLYPDKDKRVFSPIGVNTGGKTPNEIAVSIAAEILAVSNNVKPIHMKEAI